MQDKNVLLAKETVESYMKKKEIRKRELFYKDRRNSDKLTERYCKIVIFPYLLHLCGYEELKSVIQSLSRDQKKRFLNSFFKELEYNDLKHSDNKLNELNKKNILKLIDFLIC